RLMNDANCFALSEATDGAAAGAHVVFGVILGTGVGGGIVVDGRCLAGANLIAGEWGHNPLPWLTSDEQPGPPRSCGQRGGGATSDRVATRVVRAAHGDSSGVRGAAWLWPASA